MKNRDLSLPPQEISKPINGSVGGKSTKKRDLLLFWNTIKSRSLYRMGAILVVMDLILVVFGPLIATHDPMMADPTSSLLPPSLTHFFGTDRTGMDIFSRTVMATRTDLLIAVGANLISFSFGILFGVISGYYKTWWSDLIARSLDIVHVIPNFVLAMTAVAVLGSTTENLILVIGFFNIPLYTRLVRSKVYSVREMKYVESAHSLGNSNFRLLGNHILPASLQPAIVQFSVVLGWGILTTSGLSFIGVGVKPPTPEWGSMVSLGVQQIFTGEWWVWLFPGLALALSVLGFAITGDAVDHVVDPLRR